MILVSSFPPFLHESLRLCEHSSANWPSGAETFIGVSLLPLFLHEKSEIVYRMRLNQSIILQSMLSWLWKY